VSVASRFPVVQCKSRRVSGRGNLIERTVWALFVVFASPVLDHRARFPNRHECPAVQAAVAKDTVERFVMTVLPGSAISLLNSRALPTCYLAGVAETQL
jgi:hypothetical protein